jgi:glutamate-1-semialdehyde 2,1-aminomutase
LTSLDGDVYVDFLGEYTAGIYGHSNEKIAAAVAEAMLKGWNYGGPNPYERELARKVT